MSEFHGSMPRIPKGSMLKCARMISWIDSTSIVIFMSPEETPIENPPGVARNVGIAIAIAAIAVVAIIIVMVAFSGGLFSPSTGGG